jgi:signal transduction histidine kinase
LYPCRPVQVQDELFSWNSLTQEALNNISKHTQATQVIVKLVQHSDEIELVIQDNGSGFDLKDTPPDHFGLKNMMDRAKSINADINIMSSTNEGTTITVVGEIT